MALLRCIRWPTLLAVAAACIVPTSSQDPLRYRLGADSWDPRAEEPAAADLLDRYPEFFTLILDPSRADEPNLLALRDDLEHTPTDLRNYDALNAIAVAYFLAVHRQEAARHDESSGMAFLSLGFRSAKLVAVPWRAYGEVTDPRLRDAILDFYQDAGSGRKHGSRPAIGRLPRIVDSLAAKEPDEARRLRIETLRDEIAERALADRN